MSRNYHNLSSVQRQFVAVNTNDLFLRFIYEIGMIFDDDTRMFTLYGHLLISKSIAETKHHLIINMEVTLKSRLFNELLCMCVIAINSYNLNSVVAFNVKQY